jgi:hypothetical protein
MAVASGPIADRLARSPAVARRLAPGGFLAAAALLHLLYFAAQVPGELLRHKPYQNVSEYIEAARVLDASLPPGSRGGAFQSGTVGYFARHTVINLDGVVNRDAARALREKRMSDYIREEGIEAIIDWPLWFEALLVQRSPEGAGRGLGPAEPAGRFLLIRVQPARNRIASLGPQR